MSSSAIHYACYFTIFSLCVEEGYGRWKKLDRDKIEHDITALKHMADKLEHEIEDYYYDDSDEMRKSVHYNKGEKADRNFYSYLTTKTYKPPDRYLPQFIVNRTNILSNHSKNGTSIEKTKPVLEKEKTIKDKLVTITVPNTSEPSWPKFDEMLLAMGKRYDWKNDRWIKVKKEQDDIKVASDYKNRLDFLSKHRFSYRTVKLNRVKAKRNIVVAVTAVR